MTPSDVYQIEVRIKQSRVSALYSKKSKIKSEKV